MHWLVDWLVDWPARTARFFEWLAPLFARVAVGWVFMWTGWGKLHNLPFVIENFAGWNIPYPDLLAPFVAGVEFVGGLCLILGLFTRLAAAPLVIIMIVAIRSALWDQVDSAETLLGFEETVYMAVFFWLAVAGPGKISLDYLLQRWNHSTEA